MNKRYYTEELIDLETGELTTRLRTVRADIGQLAMADRPGWDEWDVPTEAEASRAALEVVVGFYTTKPLLTGTDSTGADTKPKRGPKPMHTVNPFADYFAELDYNADAKAYQLPSQVEDVLTVVSRTSHGNTVFPQAQLVRCMRLSTIGTAAVLHCLNCTREPAEHVGADYAKRMAKACRTVIERLQAVEIPEIKSGYSLNDDTQGYAEYCLLGRPAYTALTNGKVYSEGERRELRRLATCSQLHKAA